MPRAEPPDLPGFTPIRPIGRGGFAEVHLYLQSRPRREVAVKILTRSLRGDATPQALEAEANLLASVSGHPAIVTIHGADISPDGRPFIVMEHCPRPNLQRRVRAGRLSLPEVLRIGVQLCGAVETAHRAGVLHRDIKPANVLFTRWDRPALADFGIAGSLTEVTDGPVGLSVPWSPSEAFDGPDADARLDVYALGATIYTALAGRAPYHLPNGDNGHQQQMTRIRLGDLPPIGREDLPPTLARVIAQSLSRDREHRQASAIALGRDLQRVQAELALEQTAMDVIDDVEEMSIALEDTRTRVRPASDRVESPHPAAEDDTVRAAAGLTRVVAAPEPRPAAARFAREHPPLGEAGSAQDPPDQALPDQPARDRPQSSRHAPDQVAPGEPAPSQPVPDDETRLDAASGRLGHSRSAPLQLTSSADEQAASSRADDPDLAVARWRWPAILMFAGGLAAAGTGAILLLGR